MSHWFVLLQLLSCENAMYVQECNWINREQEHDLINHILAWFATLINHVMFIIKQLIYQYTVSEQLFLLKVKKNKKYIEKFKMCQKINNE